MFKRTLCFITAAVITASIFLTPANTQAADTATNLLNLALKEKTFYHFNMAYAEILKISDKKRQDTMMSKLATLTKYVWTEDIKAINAMITEMVSTSSGRTYDQLEARIRSSKIVEVDKQYLLWELTSWGRKLVWTPDYVQAVDSVVAAWTAKDEQIVNNSKTAIMKLTNSYSRDYLLEQWSGARNKFYNIVTEDISFKGNTTGNLNNLGRYAQRGEWVYYSHSGYGYALYREKLDGSRRKDLTVSAVNSISVTDKYIFYINESDNKSIYRMNLDGSNNIKLAGTHFYENLVFAGGYLFFVDLDDSSKIYRMNFDGSNKVKVSEDTACRYISYDNNAIYYVTDHSYYWGGTLKRMNLDGSGKTVVYNTDVEYPIVNGSYIYFIDTLERKNNIVRINKDGSGYTRLVSEKTTSLNLAGNVLYYSNLDDGNTIYAIKTDGTRRTKVNNNASSDINIAGNNIYHQTSRSVYPPEIAKTVDLNTPIAAIDKNSFGNSNSNSLNGALTAADENYIYERKRNDGYIYRYKPDGSEEQLLVKNVDIASISVIGDWLYFAKADQASGSSPEREKIYRIKKDGSGLTEQIANGKTNNMIVTGEWIYYISIPPSYMENPYSGAGRIKKVRLDGTGDSYADADIANPGYAYKMNIVGDYIYYISAEDSSVYRMKTDGTGKVKIINSEIYHLDVHENYLYFAKVDGFNTPDISNTYRYDLTTGTTTEISIPRATTFIINGNKIYYTIFNSLDCKVYSASLDGSNKTLIADTFSDDWLNVTAGYVYYMGDDYTFTKRTAIPVK